jgi:hypothetical protein
MEEIRVALRAQLNRRGLETTDQHDLDAWAQAIHDGTPIIVETP